MTEIRPKPQCTDRVIELLSGMDDRVNKVNGLVGSHLLKPLAGDGPLVMMSAWQDEKSWDEHHKAIHENRDSVPEIKELMELCEPEHSEKRFKQVHLVHGPCAPNSKA